MFILVLASVSFRGLPPASATYTCGRLQTYAWARADGGLLALRPMRAWRICNTSPCGFPARPTSVDDVAIFEPSLAARRTTILPPGGSNEGVRFPTVAGEVTRFRRGTAGRSPVGAENNDAPKLCGPIYKTGSKIP